MNRKFSIGAALITCAFSLSVSPAVAEDENTGWDGEISLSGSAQTGTTESISGTADASTTRNWEKDSVTARFTGTYGTSKRTGDSRETTQDTQLLQGDWKHVIHNRFFWDSRTGVGRDSTQNRKIRFLVNSGPGYRFWEGADGSKHHFDVSTGVGYRYEVYDGNTDNTGGTDGDYTDTDIDQFVDVVAGFEYKNMLFDDKIDFTHTGSIAMPGNSPSAFLARSEVIIGVPLTASWSFRTSFLVEYTNEVPDDVKETMTRTTIGLGYKF